MVFNRYQYSEIILNSEDFSSGNKNRPEFQFDQIIDDSEYFQVHRVTIPFSYYVFDAERTSITVNAVTYTWEPGNYTASEWISMMALKLPATMIASWDVITNKITFTNTLGAAFSVTFPANTYAYEELGFPSTGTASISVGPNHVVTAPFVANFSGPNFLYLRSPMASIFNNSEMFYSYSTKPNISNDILAMIPVDENRNSVINYVDQSNHLFQWKTVGQKRIKFYFTLGNRTTPIDLNGQPFQLRLHGYSLLEEGPMRYN